MEHANIAARWPSSRVGWTEQCEHACARRRREMSDAGIVADVQARVREPTGEIVEVLEPDRIREIFFGSGAPFHGNRQPRCKLAIAIQRPVLARATRER